jgi:16S rRNA (uracil1498-N3)-methyltransferase
MELFYKENLVKKDESIIFDAEESRHLSKVLRKKVGEMISVTNGKGLEWHGQIVSADVRKAAAKKTDVILHQNQLIPLHIAIAPTKSNDRLEWFLEKSTEIGVSQITPLICEHSERKVIKPERLNKILIGGIKQSAQFFLPELNPIISFEEFMKLEHPQTKLIAHCQKGDQKALHQIENLSRNILIMIGPEGDFSDREIKNARLLNFGTITLGEQRLRTETAGIVACSRVATLREISKAE